MVPQEERPGLEAQVKARKEAAFAAQQKAAEEAGDAARRVAQEAAEHAAADAASAAPAEPPMAPMALDGPSTPGLLLSLASLMYSHFSRQLLHGKICWRPGRRE